MAKTKYGKYFLTEPRLRDKPRVSTIVAPSAVLQSGEHFGAGSFSMSWRYITQPMPMDQRPHAHDFDQFLCFMGGNLENIFDFDADIELSLGEEGEKHIINTTTIVYVPKGLFHCPLTFKRIGKPVLFHAIAFTPSYYTHVEEIRIRKQSS